METPVNERYAVLSKLCQLSDESKARWDACKASHRFMAFQNKQLVIYTLQGVVTPTVLTTLTCVDVQLSIHKGIVSLWETSSGERLSISTTPTEVAPSIFLWHTFQTDLQYSMHKGVYGVRFSMLYRCKHHPAYREEQCFYMQERAAFMLGFPDATL